MDEDFNSALTALLAKTKESEDVSKIVKEIVESVRACGDKRVLELTARWDHLSVNSIKDLEMSSFFWSNNIFLAFGFGVSINSIIKIYFNINIINI